MQNKARGWAASSSANDVSTLCALRAVDRSSVSKLKVSTSKSTRIVARVGRKASRRDGSTLAEAARRLPNNGARLEMISRSACAVAGALGTFLSATLSLLSPGNFVPEPTSEFENALSNAILSIEHALGSARGLRDLVLVEPGKVSRASQVAECGVAADIALDKARLVAHDLGNHLWATLLVLSRMCALEPMNERLPDAALSLEHALAATRGLLDLLWDGIGANEVFDLNAIIETNKSLLGRLAGRGMTLSLALDPGIWVVSADPHGCILALWNLIANARDATTGQGSVKIATANVFLWGQFRGLTGQFVEIRVSDEGEGMQTEAQARAFEPLYTTRSDPRHFGLGLAQVDNFASRSQGAAEIESRGVGLGTTVKLYLPRGVKLQPVKSERHRYK